MDLIPVIIDCEYGGGSHPSGADSVLMLPLGEGSVLDHLLVRLAGLHRGEVWIVPGGRAHRDYEKRIGSNGAVKVRVLEWEALQSEFERLDTTDFVLVMEARNWLADGLEVGDVAQSSRSYRGATHGIAIGSNIDRATELIERDDAGLVKRVQRFYDTVNWPEVAGEAIAHSIVPGRSLADVRFTSLPELRQALNAKGVLCRDVPVNSAMLDLTDERDYLALSDRLLVDTISGKSDGALPSGSPEAVVDHSATVHPSARLVGPVVVQGDAVIEDGVTVVGPALVGAGSRIRRGAVVAQSVVRDGTVVPAGATIRRRVFAGANGSSGSLASHPMKAAWYGDGPEQVPQLSQRGMLVLPASADRHPGTAKPVQMAVKRLVDVVLSVLGLIALSPVLLIVALLVKLDSAGPIFFCHRREGKAGREFVCIKFRTMRTEAHNQQRELRKESQVDGPQFKLRHDPRITRLGLWLRATNADELPQLLNVLAGHMSLVGPRPSPFRENQICVPWRRARLSVAPGITGLWQICRDADRSRGGFHEWIYYDILYARHFSAWLDLKILAATAVTLGGRWSVPLSWMIPTAMQLTDNRRSAHEVLLRVVKG